MRVATSWRPGRCLFHLLRCLTAIGLLVSGAAAPASEIVWEAVEGDVEDERLYGIAADGVGGHVAVGTAGGERDRPTRGWVLRLDHSGRALWRRTIGDDGGGSLGLLDVTVLADGDAVAVGWRSAAGSRTQAGVILRLAPDGSLRWRKTVPDCADARLSAVAVRGTAGLLAAGRCRRDAAGPVQALVVPFTAPGVLGASRLHGGGAGNGAVSVAPTPDGGYLLSGWLKPAETVEDDAWLLRADASGAVRWQQRWGAATADVAYRVAALPDGDAVVVGSSRKPTGSRREAWIARFDGMGGRRWMQHPTAQSDGQFYDVKRLADETLVALGARASDDGEALEGWFARYDGSGRLLEERTLGTARDGRFYAASSPVHDRIGVAGFTRPVGAPQADGWLALIDFDPPRWTADAALARTAGCRSPTTTRTTSERLKVDLAAPAADRELNAGDPVALAWSLDGEGPKARGQYEMLVLAVPDSVRVSGDRAVVLPAGAELPFGAAYRADQARIVFPLYVDTVSDRRGSVTLRPLKAGALMVEAALLTVDACGNLVHVAESAGGALALQVAERRPRVVVQDRFTAETPIDWRRSPDGRHELRIFQNRYEVVLVRTGGLVLSRPGVEPGFSPTGRFLAAFDDNADLISRPFRIFDLLNQQEILLTKEVDTVAWAWRDAYVLIGGIQWQRIELVPTLRDDPIPLVFTTSGHWFSPWENRTILMDRDFLRLLVDEGREDSFVAASLVGPRPKEDEETAWEPAELKRPAGEWVWNLGERLALTHGFGLSAETVRDGTSYTRDRDRELVERALLKQKLAVVSPRPLRRLGLDTTEPQASIVQGVATLRTAGLQLPRRPGALAESLASRLADLSVQFRLPLRPVEAVDAQFGAPDEKRKPGEAAAATLRRLRATEPMIPAPKQASAGLVDPPLECNPMKPGVAPDNLSFWRWTPDGKPPVVVLQSLCWSGAASNSVYDGSLVVIGSDAAGRRYHELFVEEPSDETRAPDKTALKLSTFNDQARLRVFLDARGILTVASIDGASILVWDVAGRKAIARIASLADPVFLDSVILSEDGSRLLQINRDGQFHLYAIEDGAHLLSGAYVDDEIVFRTGEGYFDATFEGAEYVFLHFPGAAEHHAFSQFESTLRKPQRIAALLAGKRLAPEPPDISPPPGLNLTLDVAQAVAGAVTARIEARSVRPMQAVRLYVNGVPAAELPISGTDVRLEHRLTAPKGARWITAVAINDVGSTSVPQTAFVRLDGAVELPPRLLGLAVAIDQYPLIPSGNLSYAKRDATLLAAALKSAAGRQFATAQIDTLTDTAATPAAIVEALGRLAEATRAHDLLAVSFAGHGLRGQDGNYYFLTSATRLDDLPRTALAWSRIAEAFDRAKGTILVLLDACHSGAAGPDSVVPNDAQAAALMRGGRAGTIVLSASKGRQLSQELAGLDGGHGVFSHAVARALGTDRKRTDRNGNGVLELDEIYAAVKGRVMELTGGAQTPWLARKEAVGRVALF